MNYIYGVEDINMNNKRVKDINRKLEDKDKFEFVVESSRETGILYYIFQPINILIICIAILLIIIWLRGY